MIKQNQYIKIGVLLMSTLFVGCGGSSNSQQGGMGDMDNMGGGSNIPYLRQNHANYSEHGSNATPAPTKNTNAKSINWTIAATTEDGAAKLAEHIRFMVAQLQADKNPRAFDKVFLMEAYMKFNKYYTTSVEQSTTNVVISKTATTSCAYEVISAHSDVVSGDFFARGILNIDHSATGEAILASSACNDVRGDLTAYITARQRSMMN